METNDRSSTVKKAMKSDGYNWELIADWVAIAMHIQRKSSFSLIWLLPHQLSKLLKFRTRFISLLNRQSEIYGN